MSEVLYYAGGRDQHVGAYVFRVRNEVPGDLADQADAEQGPGRRQAAAAGGGGVNG